MARLFQVSEIAAKKRALAAESEVYRQTLKLELQNFGLYAASLKRRWSPIQRLGTVLPLAGAAAGFWLRRKQARSQPRILRTAMLGWQVYRTVSPLLHRLTVKLFQRASKPRGEPLHSD